MEFGGAPVLSCGAFNVDSDFEDSQVYIINIWQVVVNWCLLSMGWVWGPLSCLCEPNKVLFWINVIQFNRGYYSPLLTMVSIVLQRKVLSPGVISV